MNETSKASPSLALQQSAAIAIVTAPKPDPSSHESRMGQALFDPFDPSAATGIEIVEIDEEEGEAKSIEVVKTGRAGSSTARQA